MIRPAALCLLLGLLLGGCASFDAQVESGRSLADVRRFFVMSNLNDNHALDHHIAEALKARGFTAETGPLTMMPDNTQAIVTFEDNWGWDFAERLDFLRITVRDPATKQQYATATFSSRIPSRDALPVVVGRLLDRLLPPKP